MPQMAQISLTWEELHTRGGLLDELLDKTYDMALLLDDQCRILYLNERNKSILSNWKALVGQPVQSFDNVSPYEQVIRTGKAATGLLMEILGHKCFSNVIPVVDQGKTIGAMGMVMFRNTASIEEIFAQVKEPFNVHDTGELYAHVALMDQTYTFSDFIGESQAVKDLLAQCQKAAQCDYPVLLIGETGTGKEIIASGIHAARHPDTFAPYVTINCTAIPENLLESELFGHEKGAFTGADARKEGKFERAGTGDLLLDEIGDMSLHLQGKLLRVLESKEFERVGGRKVIPFRAGVIAATNKNLPRLAEQGQFRADLYYRLAIVELFLPPLRRRPEDIPLLVDHFLSLRQGTLRFTRQAMDSLQRYPWPGNVRQLKNLIDRLLVLREGEQIDADRVLAELSAGQEHYDKVLGDGGGAAPQHRRASGLPPRTLEEQEREAVAQALEYCGQNITEAARVLGISRATLYKKIEKYQL